MKSFFLVADAARARLFGWQDSEDISLDGSPRLQELGDWVHPEARLQDREVFSNELVNNRTTGPGPAHDSDDHRDAHRREDLKRFTREVARRVAELVGSDPPQRVVLVAQAQLLPELRRDVEGALPRGLQLAELAENLGKNSPSELQVAFAKHGLLPAPSKGPTPDQFLPRGQPVPGSDVKGPPRQR